MPLGLRRSGTFRHHPMESHAGYDHLLIAPRKRIGLLFTNPFGKAVRILIIGWMFLIQGKIIEARLAAIGEPGFVYTRSLTQPIYSNFDCSTQRVVPYH